MTGEIEMMYPRTLGLYAKSGADEAPEKCVVVRFVKVSEFGYEITSGLVFQHDETIDAWNLPYEGGIERVTCRYKTMAYQAFAFLKSLASTEHGNVLIDRLDDY